MSDPLTFATGEDESLVSIVGRLATETKSLATAEVAVYKAKFGETASAYKSAAMFFAVAGVLALAALIALLVGAILTVATLVGPGWATAIVVVAVLAVAAILAMIGKSKLQTKSEPVS
ncbi:putative superfamily III holin-X [Sphingomonas sp. PP-CE-1A-559]|uniref:phage holin family protein n=1 Tax=unclassified Sphingomonas TaxID=196159 RepID=UPI0008F4294B|nr:MULTISPECIES: phage holin family protein [unclassified Sphingomonas]TCP94243.1 putative superfamily III holin-X [Sphingomonas sp. PP-CE-1A-559]SFO19956.1 Putative Holin-X, holin superfamily III [Sphingomonas sp. OK281]